MKRYFIILWKTTKLVLTTVLAFLVLYIPNIVGQLVGMDRHGIALNLIQFVWIAFAVSIFIYGVAMSWKAFAWIARVVCEIIDVVVGDCENNETDVEIENE